MAAGISPSHKTREASAYSQDERPGLWHEQQGSQDRLPTALDYGSEAIGKRVQGQCGRTRSGRSGTPRSIAPLMRRHRDT
jgi:hypothetical protein